MENIRERRGLKRDNSSPDRIIISNNPLVLERFKGALPVFGGPAEVFKKALDLLDRGLVLSGHALSGSIRLSVNPFRSLVLETCREVSLDKKGIKVLLDAIDRVERAARERPVPPELIEDYAFIDLDLLESLQQRQQDPEKL